MALPLSISVSTSTFSEQGREALSSVTSHLLEIEATHPIVVRVWWLSGGSSVAAVEGRIDAGRFFYPAIESPEEPLDEVVIDARVQAGVSMGEGQVRGGV